MGFYIVQHDNRQLRRNAKNTILAAQHNAKNLRNQGEQKILETQQEMHTAISDQQRSISSFQAQSGASGVASIGSVSKVETAVASRLEQNIRTNAQKTLGEVKQLNYQADMGIWQANAAARQSKSQRSSNMLNLGYGALTSAVGGPVLI